MPPPPPQDMEAKLVVLGSQGVGKTSLVHRYVRNAFIPPHKSQTTVGASFLTTRVNDAETGSTIRLQIWDTAGQERFRSISKLYYRGAHAAILCYDITSRQSFDDMAVWLRELRDHSAGAGDMILHVVGTKSDVVAADPRTRQVPFERCIDYVAEQLHADAPATAAAAGRPPSQHGLAAASPHSNRSSGFWSQEHGWDCCHEISARDGEGVDEVFRVITRKLLEQRLRRLDKQRALDAANAHTPGVNGEGGAAGSFDLASSGATGSFRLGQGDKRRSWLGFPTTPGGLASCEDEGDVDVEGPRGMGKRRCC